MIRELMTVDDLADYLRVSKSLIYKWTSSKEQWLKGQRLTFIKFGNTIRFRKKDVEDFVDSNIISGNKSSKSEKADNIIDFRLGGQNE